jgi:hypothetical protein
MTTYHHKGDVTARIISPGRAFLFVRLRIGGTNVAVVFSGSSPAIITAADFADMSVAGLRKILKES